MSKVESNIRKFKSPKWAVIIGYGPQFDCIDLHLYDCWTPEMARLLAKEEAAKAKEMYKIYSVTRIWRDGEAL